MQGTVTKYANGFGLISAKSNTLGKARTYPFVAQDFISYDAPVIGQEVDFEIDAKGNAVMITRMLRSKLRLVSSEFDYDYA